jgi:methylated-DNA-[protein]-cysteine S-methyltransferase
MVLVYHMMESPVGDLQLVAEGDYLTAVLWGKEDMARVRMTDMTVQDNHPILRETEKQLQAYFRGELTDFDLPLLMHGTAFQKNVWQALTTIPYGETRSYGYIAQHIDNPKAVRAVGVTNSKNPISIIVPCHRVIGANGTLTGYAGGLDKKSFLLDLEKRLRR